MQLAHSKCFIIKETKKRLFGGKGCTLQDRKGKFHPMKTYRLVAAFGEEAA